MINYEWQRKKLTVDGIRVRKNKITTIQLNFMVKSRKDNKWIKRYTTTIPFNILKYTVESVGRIQEQERNSKP